VTKGCSLPLRVTHASLRWLETFAQFSTIGKMRWQNFNGDDSVQTVIFGAVNLTHPSGANTGEDFVWAQTFARENRHGLLLTWNGTEYNAVRLKKTCFLAGSYLVNHNIGARDEIPLIWFL
jgi:hypothetical protein